jgi:hypothetical protein
MHSNHDNWSILHTTGGVGASITLQRHDKWGHGGVLREKVNVPHQSLSIIIQLSFEAPEGIIQRDSRSYVLGSMMLMWIVIAELSPIRSQVFSSTLNVGDIIFYILTASYLIFSEDLIFRLFPAPYLNWITAISESHQSSIMSQSTPKTAKQWTIEGTNGFDSLKLNKSAPVNQPGDYECLVKFHAASLNYRDLIIPQGDWITSLQGCTASNRL